MIDVEEEGCLVLIMLVCSAFFSVPVSASSRPRL
jgi:hypothetical protein